MTNQTQANPAQALGVLLDSVVAPYVDAKISEAMANIPQGESFREVIVKIRNETHTVPGRVHPQFDKVLNLVANGANVLLTGPAGCGKTHMASQLAEGLGLSFGAISGSGGVTESQILGRLLPTGDHGRFEYSPSPFVNMYSEGGLFLFDELDGFDPNVLLSVNQASANNGFFCEPKGAAGGEAFIPRHKNTVLIASANTYGTGSGSMYVGRNQLDAATLDRYYFVSMDYDREFERSISSEEICSWVWRVREGIQANKLRRIFSTRTIQKATIAKEAGLDWREIKADLLTGWTRDELQKIGEDA